MKTTQGYTEKDIFTALRAFHVSVDYAATQARFMLEENCKLCPDEELVLLVGPGAATHSREWLKSQWGFV